MQGQETALASRVSSGGFLSAVRLASRVCLACGRGGGHVRSLLRLMISRHGARPCRRCGGSAGRRSPGRAGAMRTSSSIWPSSRPSAASVHSRVRSLAALAWAAEFVRKVQRVDRRAAGPVEAPGAEADHFLIVLGRDVRHHPRGQRCSMASPNVAPPTPSMMTSNSPPGCATTAVAPRRPVSARCRAASRTSAVTSQRRQPGQLNRHPADSAGRTGDQHAFPEHQAPDLQGPQRCQPGRGKGGSLHVRKRRPGSAPCG